MDDMSKLVEHAEREMKLAGLDKPESAYGGMLYDAVIKMVKVHSEEGHSGGSHEATMAIFNRVINFKTLTPIGTTEDEWFKHDYQTEGANCWQNIRQSSVFSQDGGKTWYDLDDKEKKNWPPHMLKGE